MSQKPLADDRFVHGGDLALPRMKLSRWGFLRSPRSVFGRNVLRVLIGTGLAQSISVASIPVLGWLYLPAELGVFAAFYSFASIFSSLAGLRYELAISTVSDDGEAWDILRLVWCLNLLWAAVCLAGLLVYIPHSLQDLGGFVYALPLMVGLNAGRSSATYWLARRSCFSATARMKVLHASVTVALQIVLAYLVGGGRALVLAACLGSIAALVYGAIHSILSRPDLTEHHPGCVRASWAAILRRHARFPLYLLPAHGVNVLSGNLPILFFGSFAGPEFAGMFFIAWRIVQTPVIFLGRSIAQVFYPEAARQYNLRGECGALFGKVVRRLACMYAVVLPLIGVLAYIGLPVVLGVEKWTQVGTIALLLSVFSIVEAVDSPVSSIWIITKHQLHDLVWQVGLLVLVAVGLWSGCAASGPFGAVIGYGAAITLGFGINLVYCRRFSRGR